MTREEIDAEYTCRWSSIGDGNPELHDNNVPMTEATYYRLMAEIRAADAWYKAALIAFHASGREVV